MAEAIATEGGDVDAEETDEADLVAIEVKGSIKTDEVKGNIFLTMDVLMRHDRIVWSPYYGRKSFLKNMAKEDVQSSTTEEEGSDGDHDDMKNAKCLKLKCTEEYFKIHLRLVPF